MKRMTSLLLIVALLAPTMAFAQPGNSVPRSREYWQAYVSRLPIGSTVQVRTMDGRRLTAVLAVVNDEGITLEKRTRIPEPARQIPFDQIQQLEPKTSSTNIGKAVGIGVAVGAATFFGILMLLAAAYGD